ncbi:hypothetical protein TNCV_4715601 [Trichonephila clavipes]|nr:hypothetical protein TNCV_4715601 [Trichonephila clavipes]
MDEMRLSIRLWGILFHSSSSAISSLEKVAGGFGRAAMRHPSMSQTCSIDSGSEEHAGPFHTLYCFSLNHVLHQTSSMRSGIIILENKGIFNGSSVRDDMRSKVPRLHTFGRQSAITNDMQVRTSAYADSTPYHQPDLLYCDLSRTNAGLFRVPLSSIQEHVGCHTLD